MNKPMRYWWCELRAEATPTPDYCEHDGPGHKGDERCGWVILVFPAVIDQIGEQRDGADAAVAVHGSLAEGFFHALTEVLDLLGGG